MILSEKTRAAAAEAERRLAGLFSAIDETARAGTERVLDVFRKERVSESMFMPTTGYGYGDVGRDAIDRIVAGVFGAEAGFMRPALISGTHALTVGLFGLLRPGDVLLSVTGAPYDTLRPVIGMDGADGSGSLADFGVRYAEVPFAPGGGFDWDGIAAALRGEGERVRVVYFQRSKGYLDRPTLRVSEIAEAIRFVRAHAKNAPFFVVDNCYGEFTEETEPCAVGADLIIGSLIKNPGGGMADVGGYLCGTRRAAELAGNRLCCPGVGLDAGASLGQNRNMLRGLFYAPHTVAQALKTAHLAAYLFAGAGFAVNPGPFERRSDIIQTVSLGSPELLCRFCEGIQSASPVDAHVRPVPSPMPGYADEVIMAAGAFVQGSSIELSADGPIRPPYAVYFQGGLTWYHAKLGILRSLQSMADAGLVTI